MAPLLISGPVGPGGHSTLGAWDGAGLEVELETKLRLRDRVQAVVAAYETGPVRPGDA